MNRAIIFAARQFIGFELCKQLLENGYDVIALDHKEEHEDKWLEIGRNANVIFQTIDQPLELNEETYNCIIPIYDYFIEDHGKEMRSQLYEKIEVLLAEKNASIERFLFVLPSQFMFRQFKEEYSELYQVFIKMKGKMEGKQVQEIYIPTIYGPWQSEGLLFQQLISKNKRGVYKDDCSDAIYLEDAIRTIIERMNMREESNRILLQNEEENQWEQCVDYLDISFPYQKKQQSKREVTPQIVKVHQKITLEKGLEKQLQCYKLFS